MGSSKEELRLPMDMMSPANGMGGSRCNAHGHGGHMNDGEANGEKLLTPKLQRLVDWNVDQLSRLLRLIVVRRKALRRLSNSNTHCDNDVNRAGTVLEEVREV